MKQKVHLYLSLFAFLIIAACNKGGNNSTSSPSSAFTPTAGMYISGIDNNQAVYWYNGVEHTLEAPNSVLSQAYQTVADSNNVYIAGHIMYANNNAKACYWKNGVLNLMSTDHSSASSIFVSNTGDIYLTGFKEVGVDMKPVYWKNGVEVNLPISIKSGSAVSIKVVGNDVYVLGRDDNTTHSLVLWKNGIPSFISSMIQYTDPMGFNNLIVENGTIYTVGMRMGGYKQVDTGKLWVNGVETPFGATNNCGNATGVLKNGSDLYVTGSDTTQLIGGYWKNGTYTALNRTAGSNFCGTSRIVIHNADFYSVGAEGVSSQQNNSTTPAYWINGVETILPFQSTSAYAVGICFK